jgi:hypothetical protein
MTSFTLDRRARLSIELALTADRHDPPQRALQEAEARELGMSGAEIDAARRGWSFDVQTSIALALATGDGDRRMERERALRAGITEKVCREIEMLADSITDAGNTRNRAKSSFLP